jgi:hypothetical protein
MSLFDQFPSAKIETVPPAWSRKLDQFLSVKLEAVPPALFLFHIMFESLSLFPKKFKNALCEVQNVHKDDKGGCS